MGPIGMQEMILIVILALLLVGPKKLPELFRVLGKGMSEFRRAKNELKSTFDTHMRELERETRLEEYKKSAAITEPQPAPYGYTADEYGTVYGDNHHNGTGAETVYSSEPAVETHAHNGLAPATPVAGTVPRSSSSPALEAHETSEVEAGEAKDGHSA